MTVIPPTVGSREFYFSHDVTKGLNYGKVSRDGSFMCFRANETSLNVYDDSVRCKSQGICNQSSSLSCKNVKTPRKFFTQSQAVVMF